MSRRLAAAAALLCALAPADAPAQILKSPTFIFEPGAITVNAISGSLGRTRGTGFNLRFLAVIPTGTPRVSLLFGTRFAPYGLSDKTRFGQFENEPAFFYGVIFPLLYKESDGGWLDVTLPLFGQYYAGGGGANNARPFGTDLFVEGAATVQIGQKLLKDLGGLWGNVALYVRVDQNLTPSAYTFIGSEGQEIRAKADRWNPSFQYGLSIPFFGQKLGK